MGLHGTADVAMKPIPMISIVILAGSGNTSKTIKKAAIRAKEIPGINLRRNICFRFSIVDPPIMLRLINSLVARFFKICYTLRVRYTYLLSRPVGAGSPWVKLSPDKPYLPYQ